MNAKYAVALILALQVSISLCEIPTPPQDLVEKYDELKSTFFKRMLNLYSKVQEAAAPYVEKATESEQGSVAKEYIETLQSKPEVQAVVKIAAGLGQEAAPLVDKTRTAALGLYGHYLRPYIGESLNDGINHIKVILDKYMPAE